MTWNPRALPSQAGTTVVVTGAGRGIGYFVAEQLAAAGARVIVTTRGDTAVLDSIRSRAAILKLGAQFEGVLRRTNPRADDTWRDTAVYSILGDEWPAVRDGLEGRLARFQ